MPSLRDQVHRLDRLLLPLALAAAATLALAVISRGDQGRATAAPARAGENEAATPDVTKVIERINRVTVLLEGNGVYGTGILIDPAKGLILTSQHVVDEMGEPRVTRFDGQKGKARRLKSDDKLDLALLEAASLADPDLPAPRLGDITRLRVGQELYAIGAPRKLAFTVSRGIVSYLNREYEGKRWIQLDMAINDGNSGGPVFTASGEIVGVMSFILRHTQGLSFALPVESAATLLK